MTKRGLGRGIDEIIPEGVSQPVEISSETASEEAQTAPWGQARIGQLLRSRREHKRLSLEDAQDATKIRKRYLEALESGEDTSSPGDVYFRGFLKIYGDFLGLDGAALVEQYKATKEREQRPVQDAPAPEAAVPEATVPQVRRRARERASAWRSPFLFLLAAILAVVVGSRMLSISVARAPAAPEGPPAVAGSPATTNEPSQPAPTPATDATPAGGSQAQPESPQASSPPGGADPKVVREERSEYLTAIGIKADNLSLSASISHGPCWVRVEADSQLVAEELLEAGAQRTWQASNLLKIRIGAPWTMRLALNGLDLGIAGPQGGPAKNLEISRIK